VVFLPESEISLIQRAIQHDDSAFVCLYDLHVDKVYRHVYYRVRDRDDAEDITQEVFVRAWKAIGRYKATGAPFLSWLTTIAHNLVIDHYKHLAKHKTTAFDESKEGMSHQIIDKDSQIDFDGDIDRDLLEKAISKLKGDKQKVVLMHFIDGLSYTEIARALKKREGAIRVIQYRALKELRDILNTGTA